MKTTKFKTEDERKPDGTITDHLDRASSVSTMTHRSPYHRMIHEIKKILDTRSQLAIYEKVDNQMVNLTPKLLEVPPERATAEELMKRESVSHYALTELASFRSFASTIIRNKPSKAIGLQVSLDDVIEGIGLDPIVLDGTTRDSAISWQKSRDYFSTDLESQHEVIPRKWHKPFVRITLRKTDLVLLYEHRSVTALKSTEEGKFVQVDNKQYDHLTIGKGKVRRRSESDAQTKQILYKSRVVNTEKLSTCDKSSFVSYYEMFDTYKMLDEPKKLHFSQGRTPAEQLSMIGSLPSFHSASVVMKRLLAGNTYQEGQRRFRNMNQISRIVDKVNFKYTVKELFTIYPPTKDNDRKAVAAMSFCYTNGDILAVAYGIYSYQAARVPRNGQVCIWSMKNPCDPERFYDYPLPVVALAFSPYMPSLLAVGLFNGSVEVRDIAYFNQPPVAVSKCVDFIPAEPVLDIKWIKESSSEEEIDPFLALSQNGVVTQHRIIKSPFLASFRIMSLQRLEGLPEGLPGITPTAETQIYSNRLPQGLTLIKHPIQADIYHILTDEGCLYKCSTNYQNNYIEALRTHEGAVNHMDFSPWSPQLFLTCGNDWCIRVWMTGIFKPLLTLKNKYRPYYWAAWSRTNSTILIALNRLYCDIWDLARSTLKPVSSTKYDISNTLGIFSLDGHSLLIGKERGQVQVNALDDLPFPPHYQYDCLEKAMYKAVSNYPDLLMELKNIGYFGYPNKNFVK